MEDYEQIVCEKCHQVTDDGYLEKTGKIVCDRCVSKKKRCYC